LKQLVANLHSTEPAVISSVGLALAARQVPLSPHSAEMVPRQVHHGAPQVEGKGLGPTQIMEPSEQPHESILGQILGQVSVSG
jgi:hypothetical protein